MDEEERGFNSWENSIEYNQEGSLLELNWNFKVTSPINLSSVKSASHHAYRWALKTLHPKGLLHGDFIWDSVEDTMTLPFSGRLSMLFSVSRKFSILFFPFI